MGTITIEEYSHSGGAGDKEASVPYLGGMTRTQDASTSTTSESITLQDSTKVIRVVGAEDHRISMVEDTTGDNYATVGTTSLDFGVKGGTTLYYRLDA
jgi:hypothetical protein